ncbi:MAG: calcium-binding EGF-like domain-containing protein [Vicinamibacterales bacterium]
MNRFAFPQWTLQSAFGVALVVVLSMGFSTLDSNAQQAPAQAAAASAAAGACQEGFYGSPEKGCTDVNECASANGGCHKLASCKNTPGSRVCGACPPDFQGTGYVGCFDVNECPNGDCSDRIPTDAETAAAPAVTTSGDVNVNAVAETGAPATFTVSAKDPKDGVRPAYCLPRSGSTFPIGKTTVSCWASNSRGKLGRATLTVTVARPAF